MKKPASTVVNMTLRLPSELAARFKPTDNKSAVVKAALTAYFDARDGKEQTK